MPSPSKPLPYLGLPPFPLYSITPSPGHRRYVSQDFRFTAKPLISYMAPSLLEKALVPEHPSLGLASSSADVRAVGKTVYAWKSPQRNSGLQRIQNAIRKRIDAAELNPGDPVASERELAKTHKVSLMTARHALAGLEREGIVERRRGAGTFVAAPKIHFNKLMSYTEHMSSRGLAPRSRVLVAKVIEDEQEIAARLGLPASQSHGQDRASSPDWRGAVCSGDLLSSRGRVFRTRERTSRKKFAIRCPRGTTMA